MNVNMGKVQRTIVTTYKPAVAGFESMEEATSAAGISMNTFTKYANKNFLEVKGGGIVMDRLTGQTMSYGKAAKDATMQSRRFKFEWLSVMFAGMALDRAFGGIVRSQMELYGISGLMEDMWTVVMMKPMEEITPAIYDLIDAFMELPDSAQSVIGWSVLVVGAIGTIMLIVGQFMLAWGGFKLLGIVKPIIVASSITAATTATGTLIALLGKLAAIGVIVITFMIIYNYVRKLQEESKAFKALIPPGMKDIEPTLEARRERGVFPSGTRQFEMDPAQTQNITISPTYNITVPDKQEMERWGRENNLSLVDEIKRRIGI